MQKSRGKLFDKTLWKFILVGFLNTLIGTGIMFLFYNVLGLNYWISSASNYVFGSVFSYIANKRFTFQRWEKSGRMILRFIANISLCYLIAYGLAKPLMRLLLADFGVSARENAAMLTGMCLFVGFNYLGQRFFVFREKDG